MDTFEKERLALISLIESWKSENVLLALQIMEGDEVLKNAVLGYFRPMLQAICDRVVLEDLATMPEKLKEAILYCKEIPYFKSWESLFCLVPIRYATYIGKNLKELPWWLFKMPQIEEIDFSDNPITEIPEDIGLLENLIVLKMNSCKLTRLPESIGNLSKLSRLQLDFNQITELPESAGNLTSLTWLCLEKNKVNSLPKSLTNLKVLRWLSIEGTPLGEKFKVLYGMHTSVDSEFFQQLLDA